METRRTRVPFVPLLLLPLFAALILAGLPAGWLSPIPMDAGHAGEGAGGAAVHHALALTPGIQENLGQGAWRDVRYLAAGGGARFGFGTSAIRLLLPDGQSGQHLVMSFPGSDSVDPIGQSPLPHVLNSLSGPDPNSWVRGVRSYAAVEYPALFPGSDLVVRVGEEGAKYEFRLSSGAMEGALRLRFEGSDAVELERDGGLRASVAGATVRDEPPVGILPDGLTIPCSFLLLDTTTVSLSCPGRPAGSPIRIDPLISSTYYGGGDLDSSHGIGLDSTGNIYIAGETQSTNLPTTPGALNTTSGGGMSDSFVASFTPDGATLRFATFLGGPGYDAAYALEVLPSGETLIGGLAGAGFPTTAGAYRTASLGGGDGFVARLSPDGANLIAGTYLGGSGGDEVRSVHWQTGGGVLLSGTTSSPGLPTMPATADGSLGGGRDAFIGLLDANLTGMSLLAYVGGSDDEGAAAAIATSSGEIVLAGGTASSNFPTTPGAIRTTYGGLPSDGFLVRLRSTTGEVLGSTFIGGDDEDRVNAVALDPAGRIVVAGISKSADFPTTPGAIDTTTGGTADAFLAILPADLGNLVHSTLLGGDGHDYGSALLVEPDGQILLAGSTASSDFPTTEGAGDRTWNGLHDAFIVAIAVNGGVVTYGTYVGGSDEDSLAALVRSSDGTAIVTGSTTSKDLPTTTAAYDRTYNGVGIIPSSDVLLLQDNLTYGLTITSVPEGLPVTTDGMTAASPRVVAWRAGSSHAVAVPEWLVSGIDNRTRFAFRSWSDSQPRTHPLLARSGANLTATFATEHLVRVGTTPSGLPLTIDDTSVPTPWEGWWENGSTHQVAAPGVQSVNGTLYRFLRWDDATDLHGGGPVDRPADVTAVYELLREPDFHVVIEPAALTVRAGGETAATVRLDGLNGYLGPAARVNAIGLPRNATAVCTPEAILPNETCVLRIATALTSPAGNYTVRIQAANGTVAREEIVHLEILPPADFTLVLDPANVSGKLGGNATVGIHVLALDGYAGPAINLSLHHVIPGLNWSISPARVEAPGLATLELGFGPGILPGIYDIPVQSENGSVTHLIDLRLTIREPDPARFEISFIPSLINIEQGGRVGVLLTVTVDGYLPEPVFLTIAGAPPELLIVHPTTIEAGGDFPVGIRAAENATPGAVLLSVDATAGLVRRSATLAIQIVAAGASPPAPLLSPQAAGIIAGSFLGVAVAVLGLGLWERPRDRASEDAGPEDAAERATDPEAPRPDTTTRARVRAPRKPRPPALPPMAP